MFMTNGVIDSGSLNIGYNKKFFLSSNSVFFNWVIWYFIYNLSSYLAALHHARLHNHNEMDVIVKKINLTFLQS